MDTTNATRRAEILHLLRTYGGLTMKEIAAHLGVQFNRISGRGTELKRERLIKATNERRLNSRVLEIA
jgi:predicted ArsR family transcriptional regulator